MENSLYVKYFEDMIIKTEVDKITLNEFINYCRRLEKAVKQSYIENPIKYAVKLLNARVEPIRTDNSIRIYNSFKLSLIALSITILETPEYYKTLDAEYEEFFREMKKIILSDSISFNEFTEFYTIVKFVIKFPTKSINLERIIRLLFDSRVTTISAVEYNQVNNIKNELIDIYTKLKNDVMNKQKKLYYY